jgi:alpha-L-fucosidase
MNERQRKLLTAEDFRFTAKENTLYAFSMGWPKREAVVKALESNVEQVRKVELLGYKGRLRWKQEADGLKVQLPVEKPCDHAVALKIVTA